MNYSLTSVVAVVSLNRFENKQISGATPQKLGHWHCCLCYAHARWARTDQTERARYGIYRPGNVTICDKCTADAVPIQERQLDAHREGYQQSRRCPYCWRFVLGAGRLKHPNRTVVSSAGGDDVTYPISRECEGRPIGPPAAGDPLGAIGLLPECGKITGAAAHKDVNRTTPPRCGAW